MSFVRTGKIVAICVAAALSSAALAGPDAAAIMKKATASIKGAKSYEAVWLMTVSMGQMGSMTLNMDMKSLADGRTYAKTTVVGTPTGPMAMGAGAAAMTTVADGKNAYIYMPAMKSYRKMPQPKGQNGVTGRVLGGADMPGAKYTLVGTEKVSGNPCYKIKVSLPANAPGVPPGAKPEMTLFLDQNTYRPRQMKSVMSMSGPGGPPGGVKISTTMLLKSDKVGGNIEPSVFKFTPPAGVTEMKGGPGGMMGGGMGRPGPPR